jgi:antitoxin component of RelBE/YafQ-DinJ toxin-antitoxin module
MLRMSLVTVRLTKADKARVRAADTQDGLTVSEWLRILMARAMDEAPD